MNPRRLIEAVASAVIAREAELTALDQAIGDGDHGLNLKRGFEAVLAELDGIATRPLPEAIGARTEHLRIVKSEGAAAHGRVTWIEHLGDQNHLHVVIDTHEVVTLAEPDSGLAVGDEVGVSLMRPLFFDAEGERVAA